MTRSTFEHRRRQPIKLGLATASAIAALMLASTGAYAASGDRIGDAVVIVNTVFADYEKAQRTLATGDDVRQNEVIEVTNDSRGELKLDDDTKLALGPGSRLVLDTFVYDSEKKAGSVVIDMAKGAFRFITGVAAKPTYVIKTPNASITVRGTIFDVAILPDDTVWLLLHEGGVEVTGTKSACRVLDQPGRMIRISKDGVVGQPVDWRKLQDNGSYEFDAAFPFVAAPPQVDPTPVLTRAAIEASDLPDAPDQACLNGDPNPPVKIQRADRDMDGGDTPTKPKKSAKRRADDNVTVLTPKVKIKKKRVKEVEKPKREKTAKRRKSSGDDGEAARAAASVIIGIGIGAALGGIGKGKHGGGKHPGRGRPMNY
jgi:hypothetical protein